MGGYYKGGRGSSYESSLLPMCFVFHKLSNQNLQGLFRGGSGDSGGPTENGSATYG